MKLPERFVLYCASFKKPSPLAKKQPSTGNHLSGYFDQAVMEQQVTNARSWHQSLRGNLVQENSPPDLSQQMQSSRYSSEKEEH